MTFGEVVLMILGLASYYACGLMLTNWIVLPIAKRALRGNRIMAVLGTVFAAIGMIVGGFGLGVAGIYLAIVFFYPNISQLEINYLSVFGVVLLVVMLVGEKVIKHVRGIQNLWV